MDSGTAYKIFVLAPFAPVSQETFQPLFEKVDRFSLDQVMETINPVFRVPGPGGGIDLSISGMKDFRPRHMVKKHHELSYPAEKVDREASKPAVRDNNDRVEDILSMVENPSGKERSGSVSEPVGDQGLLTEIFSDPEFQKAESAWRGLQLLLEQGDVRGSETIDVRICPVSHTSLSKVLDHLAVPGEDQIPNLVLIDLPLSNTQSMVDLLEKTAEFSDKMMTPVCFRLDPDFFSIDGWDRLGKIAYLKHYLEEHAYIKWNKIRSHPGAGWLMVVCNGFVSRPGHAFEKESFCSSPVWALGVLCSQSVHLTGWPMSFTRYTDIRLENLPSAVVDEKTACSVQALFSEDRILQFVESGITPLVGAKNKDTAFMPRETALSGESILFSMFFNRVIETLMRSGTGGSKSEKAGDEIVSALTDLFFYFLHPVPQALSVTSEGPSTDQAPLYLISFTPPYSLLKSTEKIEFSFSRKLPE